MGRLHQVGCAVAVMCALIAGESGCSSGNAVHTANFAVPASIALVPQNSVSMELGTDQQFTATPQSASKTALTEPVFYQSSNSAVVTVAVNGIVCAGTWDSLSVPQVYARAGGIRGHYCNRPGCEQSGDSSLRSPAH